MKKGLLALLMLICVCFSVYAQQIIDANQNVRLLESKLKQIVNKSIFYNYYLGDELYTERSFINDAHVKVTSNNQIELYYYLTTQKYDVASSSMLRSEHGESVIFDPATIKDIKIKGKLSDYSKSELGLLVINFNNQVEKHTYVQRKKNEDPSLLDNPLVFEFELPFLKSDVGNPTAIQNVLIDLKNIGVHSK
jgi:hypothetical protein